MPAGKTIRTAAAYSIESLLRNAVLIETVHNTKTAKKPSVHAYHRLYVPVKTKNTLVTVRLVMEEQIDGHVTIPPYEVNLYDIIIEAPRRLVWVGEKERMFPVFMQSSTNGQIVGFGC